MAVEKGSSFSDVVSVSAGAYANIRPDADVEADINHITIDGTGNVEISHYDGTRDVMCKKIRASNGFIYAFEGKSFRVDNTNYLRVKNVGTTALEIGYDGIIAKPEIV